MSLEPIQIDIVTILKARRSPTSFVGGSTVFNVSFPRRSADMDVYIENTSLSQIAAEDVRALRDVGFSVSEPFHGLMIEAKVSRAGQSTLIEWNEADRERFFSVVEDPLFGWDLHPIDLAIQKLVAAATRREARDCIDILLLDRLFAPLAALAIAAPAKLPGSVPGGILDRALRNGIGLRQQDFDALALDRDQMPFDIRAIKTVLADAIDRALRSMTESCDQAEPGYVYCLPGTSVIQLPVNENLELLEKRGISERGLLPILEPNRQGGAPQSPTPGTQL